MICLVLVIIVSGCVYAGKSSNGGMDGGVQPGVTFGSGGNNSGGGIGNISSGLLNDLEFL